MTTMKARCFSSLLLIAAACGDSDGSDGTNSLTLTADEPAGSNCQYGGVAISTGLDSNGNGKLEEAEDPTVRYVCNGAGGSNGQNGDGGVSALQPVINTSAAPASACPAGGVQITVGFDRNGDGDISDSGETNGEPRYLCNGTGGQLTAAAAEPAGANCPAGGVAISSGTDTNQNGKLDPAEITAGATTYACTDPTAINGAAPVVVSSTGALTAGTSYSYVLRDVTTTLESANLTVPGPGIVLAIGTSVAYCGGAGEVVGTNPVNCIGDVTVAHLTISQTGTGGQTGTSGSVTGQYLSPGVYSTLTTTESFGISAAGNYTFNVLGLMGADSPGTGGLQYGPTELTLVYIPN